MKHLLLFLVACTLFNINDSYAFKVTAFVLTSELPADNGQKPIPVNVFNENDPWVIAWVYFTDSQIGSKYRIEWYGPDNSLVHVKLYTNDLYTSGYIYRSLCNEKLKLYGQGVWKVSFFYNDILYYTDTFVYEPTQPPPLTEQINAYVYSCYNESISSDEMVSNINTLILQKGYKETQFEIEHRNLFDQTSNRLTIDWIKSFIDNSFQSVWLKIGSYNYNTESDTYTQVSSHWISLQDYEYLENTFYFKIQDFINQNACYPAESILPVELSGGELKTATASKNAAGAYKLNGASINNGGDVVILEAGIGLKDDSTYSTSEYATENVKGGCFISTISR